VQALHRQKTNSAILVEPSINGRPSSMGPARILAGSLPGNLRHLNSHSFCQLISTRPEQPRAQAMPPAECPLTSCRAFLYSLS
jgi:hypothetical protein